MHSFGVALLRWQLKFNFLYECAAATYKCNINFQLHFINYCSSLFAGLYQDWQQWFLHFIPSTRPWSWTCLRCHDVLLWCQVRKTDDRKERVRREIKSVKHSLECGNYAILQRSYCLSKYSPMWQANFEILTVEFISCCVLFVSTLQSGLLPGRHSSVDGRCCCTETFRLPYGTQTCKQNVWQSK